MKLRDVIACSTFPCALFLLGQSCTRSKSLEGKSSSRERLTATELFNLRSKCTELGGALLKSMGIDAPYGGNFTSHYDQSSNRCYVKVSSRTDSSRQAVYDGQTRELLVSVDLSLKAIFVTGVAGSECQEPQGAACASAAIRKMDELMLETPADKK